MRKATGNMYDWVDITWNPIKGKCIHDCNYCYMKEFPQKEVWVDVKELNKKLGEDKTIFVCSSTDMFAKNIPSIWIRSVLQKCKEQEKTNVFLFQTKDTSQFWKHKEHYPKDSIFGTTIETNRENNLDYAPSREIRAYWLSLMGDTNFMKRRMVTIEPIMDFDLEPFVLMIKKIKPEWVNIGADSKNHSLPEPSRAKVDLLIKELSRFTEVRRKTNLERLK